MAKITLYEDQYKKATELLFDSSGNFAKGVRVDASIEFPAFVIFFDLDADAHAFAELMRLHVGKICRA